MDYRGGWLSSKFLMVAHEVLTTSLAFRMFFTEPWFSSNKEV